MAAISGGPGSSSGEEEAAGTHVLALLAWSRFSWTSTTQGPTLRLLGRGQSGELGERWRLIVVMTALRLWTARMKGGTAKGIVAAGEKVRGR